MKEHHHYTECGLNDVYLVNGFTFIDGPRGPALHIENIEGLHQAIGLCLVNEKKALAGNEVRFLRHELSLTQQSLGVILGVDAQTIARWEKGETDRVTPTADRLLRLLYLERIGKNPAISEPLRRIAELDEVIGDVTEQMLFVEDPEEGWRVREPQDLVAA